MVSATIYSSRLPSLIYCYKWHAFTFTGGKGAYS